MRQFQRWTILLITVMASLSMAQEPDLVLQTNITPAYEDMLRLELAQCDLLLLDPPENAETMRTYAKRTILHMALFPVDNKNFNDSGSALDDSLDYNGDRFEDWLEMYIDPVNFDHADSMLLDLTDLFLDPQFTEMKDEFVDIRDQFGEDFDSLASLIDDYVHDNGDHIDQIIDDLAVIDQPYIPFQFSVQVLGAKSEDVLLLTQQDFYNMDSVLVYLKEGGEGLESAGEKLDSLQNNQVKPEEMVQAFRDAISSLNHSLDKLENVLNTEPISKLSVRLRFWRIPSLITEY